MRTRIAVVALLFGGFAVGADEAPPWLKELVNVMVPQYPPKVNTVVLLNEENTVVGEGGKLTTTTRTAVKFLARQGTDGTDVSFVEQYDTASGKIRDFKAWMIMPSGKVKKYGKEDIVDVACAENDVYNECRRRIVSGKRDADTGAVFGYESVVEHQVYSNQLTFTFQQREPVRLARMVVTVPANWEVKSMSFNGAPKEASPAGSTYTWQMQDLAAVEPEIAGPSFGTVAPWVAVNLIGGNRAMGSWVQVAKLMAELNEGTATPDEAMTLKARELTAGATSELDKIRAIGQFAQQVNYVSIQVNLAKGGGYRPHLATQVFQKRYGDCKDKANLMRAMLKAIGITALPVAIYSGDRTHVTREWPSLGAFNHAISAIRVGPDTKAPAVLDHPKLGRLLFFDPTDPHVPAGHLPDHEQASFALVGDAEAGDLVQVPAAPALSAARQRTVEAVLNADGGLTGSFVDRRSGSELPAARSGYRGSSKPDYGKSVERWVARGIPGAATTGIEIADQEAEFVLKGKFTTERYAQQPQMKMLIFRAAPLRHYDVVRLTEKTRKYPVVIDTDVLDETVRIGMPEGFKVDEVPDSVKVDSPFGKFEAKWVAEGHTMVFQRRLEIPAQTVEAARYGELRKFLDLVYGSPEAAVILMR